MIWVMSMSPEAIIRMTLGKMAWPEWPCAPQTWPRRTWRVSRYMGTFVAARCKVTQRKKLVTLGACGRLLSSFLSSLQRRLVLPIKEIVFRYREELFFFGRGRRWQISIAA